MICRVHSGEPALEAKCNGPCGRVLPLNSFSKSSRSKGVHLCIQCQSWISTQDAEDGRTPIAAPSHERDFDEQINGVRLPLVPDLYAEYAGLDEDDDYDEEAAQRNLNGQDDSDDDFQNALRTMKLAEQKIVYNFDCEHSDDEDVM
ncbi:hypothetical protein VDGE_06936 [Verticillium dahliae]|uniref:Stc1 domain-containing protein n=1 Tax=Verticillium dahliae TaxID=27337 RepID=A0A444SB76_VERDA|nr:hypothetical protein VDGE_06936 [Verticillium dahliae]